MTYICFSNPGELDLRALRIHGINAKPNSTNPIGFFGTGLKYAIAVCLREGFEIFIQPGDGRELSITLEKTYFRGKDFYVPYLEKDPLPFTLELGKHWEVWQVYRELRSNASDENGIVSFAHKREEPAQNAVRIYIRGDAMCDVHSESKKYFFDDPQAIQLSNEVQRSTTNPGVIFYRGIRVGDFDTTPSPYSYNIMSTLNLTEDRTISSYFPVYHAIEAAIEQHEDDELVREYLESIAHNSVFEKLITPVEQSINLQLSSSRAAKRVALEMYKKEPHRLNPKYFKWCRTHLKETVDYKSIDWDAQDREIIQNTETLFRLVGLPLDQYKVRWKVELGDDLLGKVEDGIIFIGLRAFEEGERCVIATVLEEFIHRHYGISDYSRAFQDKIIRLWATLAQRYVAQNRN